MRIWFVALLLATAACGSNKDPFVGGDDDTAGDDDTTASPDAAPGGGPDAAPSRACAPTPSRVIVLGDSITACSVIGGANNAACVSKQVSDYVKATYAPNVQYVNRAVGGAVLDDMPAQIDGIPAGTGPALVVIYIGGNDLAPYIFQSDAAATAAWTDISDGLNTTWQAMFAKLADPSKFPDGATVLMNEQYNPFDDCTAAPYNLSPTKIEILHQYNAQLGDIAAAAGDAAVIVDQYTPFLGHGHHYAVTSCPHYLADSAPYMEDLIHPNAAGNVVLAHVMEGGIDRLYGAGCTP